MANDDMANFACMVQDWSDSLEGGGPGAADALAWASDLADAIRGASDAVASDRRRRGCASITARDRAREDAKAKALDRRIRILQRTTRDSGGTSAARLKRSILKLRMK